MKESRKQSLGSPQQSEADSLVSQVPLDQMDNFAKAMHKLGEGEIEAKLGLHGGDRGVGKSKAGREPAGGKRRSRGNVASDLVRIVDMVMSRNYAPVIVFSFSKRECEVYANSLMRKNFDFNDSNAKQAITQIFRAAIENLSEDDRKLPQVEHMLPLLKRGIGIHHGGLVPLVKEVVELLFQERLLKCLFATETFAMGIKLIQIYYFCLDGQACESFVSILQDLISLSY